MRLLILSRSPEAAKRLLPALEFLDHGIAIGDMRSWIDHLGTTLDTSAVDAIVVDASTDLATASTVCRTLAASEDDTPVMVVVSIGGLAALKTGWGFNDWLLPDAMPAEVETRLRLLVDRATTGHTSRSSSIGELHIDEDTYVVRLRGRPLDLTFREFELLKYLANNPGRVFTRGQLLQEVWGYDYYGGTRTVDVHIRRLRAKLGPEYEQFIGTVRGVGYKLDPEGPPENR